MAVYDPAPLKIVAHGTTNAAGTTQTLVGCTVGVPAASVYTVTLDPGELGFGPQYNAASARMFVQILGAAGFAQTAKASANTFTVSTFNSAGAATNQAFDFVIFLTPGV